MRSDRGGAECDSSAAKLNELYGKWLQEASKPLTDPPWKDINFAEPTVFFSLLLDCDETPASNLQATLQSLRAQTFPFWELYLVSRSPFTRVRLRGMVRGLKRFVIVPPHEVDFHGTHVAYLTAGDVLDENALHWLSQALLQHKDSDVVYCDEDRLDENGLHLDPWFKPGWNPALLLSQNYIGHLCAISLEKAREAGSVDLRYGSAGDFDLLLRVIANGARVERLARVCCHILDTPWRRAIDRKREKREAKLLAKHLSQRGVSAKVTAGMAPHTRLVRFPVEGSPLVSIIIPFKDKAELLERCVNSILRRTSYPQFEIILVSNNSEQKETAEVVSRLCKHAKVRALEHNVPFNYSAINNWAANEAAGDYLLFLNNDTEIIEKRWLEYMLEYAQLPETGAVGAKLLFPDGTLQHAGVILGMTGMAGHIFSRQMEACCYKRQASVVRNYLAVTAACMLLSRKKFQEAGGFDEEFTLCGSDVALCLQLVSSGYRNVYHPGAVLIHHEKTTRGTDIPAGDYTASFRYYQPYLKGGDPYYNPNLSLASKDCSLRFDEEDFYPELARRYGNDLQPPGGE